MGRRATSGQAKNFQGGEMEPRRMRRLRKEKITEMKKKLRNIRRAEIGRKMREWGWHVSLSLRCKSRPPSLSPSLLRNRSPNVGPAAPQSEGYSVHGMCKLNIVKCDTTHITRMLCMYSVLLCSPRVELDMQQLFSAGYQCDSAAAADNRGSFQ